MVVRSEALICSRLTVGIKGSDPAEYIDVRVLCVLCVVSGSGHCDRLVTRSEEPYRVCVCMCV